MFSFCSQHKCNKCYTIIENSLKNELPLVRVNFTELPHSDPQTWVAVTPCLVYGKLTFHDPKNSR